MMRVLGKRYQEFLDNIEAYYYFPLAIAKESLMTHGTLRVRVKPLAGVIDQAGGLAFALRDWANYFVFRVNALSDTAILFEFKNGRRIQRKVYPVTLETGTWRHLRVDLEGRRIRTFLEDQPVMEYDADRDLDGYAGLWTKADSVTLFNDFQREEG
jgi:pyruvate,water dikinase